MDRREYIQNTLAVLGIALSGVSATELLSACQQVNKLEWKPVFFKPAHAEILAEIAEVILPTTDTPGAKELAVPQFIDSIVKHTMGKESQDTLVKEMEDFEKAVKSKYKTGFVSLSKDQKIEYLTVLDKEKPRSGMSMWGINLEPEGPKPTFFKKIKGMVLWGYFTSEEVGKNLFRYDPIPGIYEPCIPLNDGNAWSGD